MDARQFDKLSFEVSSDQKESVSAMLDVLTISTMLHYSYVAFMKSLTHYLLASEGVRVAQSKLDSVKTTMISEGLIKGKNATEREGAAREALSQYYDEVENAKSEEFNARLINEINQIKVAHSRSLLRVLETAIRLAEAVDEAK